MSVAVNVSQILTYTSTETPSSAVLSSILVPSDSAAGSSAVSTSTLASSTSSSKHHTPSPTIPSSSSQIPSITANFSLTATDNVVATPTSTQTTTQNFQAVGGPAGLAGIAVAGAVIIVIIGVLILYLCRRDNSNGGSAPRRESKRSTLAWGSRVGPYRLNDSGTPSPSRPPTSVTAVHKEFPEIVVLDARPSTDNSSVSLPYVSQAGARPSQGPLHLTMPYTPPEDFMHSPTNTEKSEDDLPPERYIPYVPPKQKRSNSTSTVQTKRTSALPQNGPAALLPRHGSTNSVSAAIPSSQRTSMILPDSSYAPRNTSRSNSTSSIHQPPSRAMMPPPVVVPPKGMRQSRYQSPHHSPELVREETESELGEEDLGDYEAIHYERENENGRKPKSGLYAHMKDLGEWDNKGYFYDGDSEVDPTTRQNVPARQNTKGRYQEQWNMI